VVEITNQLKKEKHRECVKNYRERNKDNPNYQERVKQEKKRDYLKNKSQRIKSNQNWRQKNIEQYKKILTGDLEPYG